MIVASHQPNFMPYMGFFYKMFVADTFTISDEVQFSRRGFQNYNYVMMNGKRTKITVPVSSHALPICETELADWPRNKKKIMKTIECCYGKAPHFDSLKAILDDVFSHEYKYISELNYALIMKICASMGILKPILKESDLCLEYSEPSNDICQICSKVGGNVYLSGSGAVEYMDMDVFDKNGIRVIWSNYEDKWGNLSVIDYIANNGCVIPKEFYEMKEKLWKN